ncbi:MAG: LysE family transporter, partial [Gammaproteobacteria bacterium]|nr:LysE family transporter [Gammaproteobacteria bacterium]
NHGRKFGMIGNLGNSAGILCHALAVALGVAAVLQYSTKAFFALKFLGVVYLVYLAIQAFRGDHTLRKATQATRASTWKIF